MLDYKKLYNSDPFGTPIEKKSLVLKNFKKLTLYHYKLSEKYKLILDNLFNSISKAKKYLNYPLYIPLFLKILT